MLLVKAWVLCYGKNASYFYSKKLCVKLQTLSTYVQEVHAITSAVQKWHHHLLRNKFITQTDQKSLEELMTQVVEIVGV